MRKQLTPPPFKTITLFHGDDPVFSICLGHVTVEVYNKAFRAEGWGEDAVRSQEELRHEWWTKSPKGRRWKKTGKGGDAVPVTVSDW